MASLSERLMEKFGLPHPQSRAGKALAAGGVCMSPELARILALPRRPFEGSAPDLTDLYSKGVPKCGVTHCRVCLAGEPRLRPIQSQMLWEADQRQGLFGMVAIGAGKTLASLLLHDAMNATRTVLLVKASLRNQLLNVDLAAYGRHFKLPPVHHAASVTSFERPGVYVISTPSCPRRPRGTGWSASNQTSWSPTRCRCSATSTPPGPSGSSAT